MKNKLFILLGVVFLLVVLGIIIVVYYTGYPTNDFNAMICHSVLDDDENGNLYCYYIYAKDDSHYKYIEVRRKIKNNKNGNLRKVKTGNINSVDDYNDLVSSMENDNKKDYSSIISCTYVDNGTNKFYDDTDTLRERLFNISEEDE